MEGIKTTLPGLERVQLVEQMTYIFEDILDDLQFLLTMSAFGILVRASTHNKRHYSYVIIPKSMMLYRIIHTTTVKMLYTAGTK